MSRKTTATKVIFVASAITASAFGMSPALAAGETVTSVGPAVASTTAAQTITVKGTNFSSNVSTVQFGACTAVTPIIVNSTTLYATKAASCTTAGKQTVTLNLTAGSAVVFNPTDAKKTVSFVAPVTGTATFNPSTGVTGTSFTVTGLSGLASTGVSATLGGKPVTGLKVVGTTGFTGKVPAGVTPGAAALVVKSAGVSSASLGNFAVKSTITVKPNVFVLGATAPEVRIDGVGFKPSGTSVLRVTICGVLATQSSTKPYTDKTVYVTAPAFAAIAAGPHGVVSATEGGVCRVQVRVDPAADSGPYTADPITPAGTATEDTVSVHTAGSKFTYAAN